MPPACANPPPAIKLPLNTVNAPAPGVKSPPVRPEPRAAHDDPFQLAIQFAAVPPAWVKSPPAMSAAPKTVSACTGPSAPVPSADHDAPFHCATLLADTTPACVNSPPAISA